MFVSEENFERQIELLNEQCNFSRLEKFEQDRKNPSEKPYVYFTFDDGYENNYSKAFPILKKHSIPATFFLCSEIFESNLGYWWDILEIIFLKTETLPEFLDISIENKRYQFVIPTTSNKIDEWSKFGKFESRKDVFLELCAHLKSVYPKEKKEILLFLIQWANISTNDDSYSKIDELKCKELLESKLISFGSHTVSHPALGFLSNEMQYQEMNDNKALLESKFSIKVNSIAYPHGHLNENTAEIAKKTNFNLGFTTEYALATQKTNHLQIPRLWMHNWDINTFNEQLKYWVNA